MLKHFDVQSTFTQWKKEGQVALNQMWLKLGYEKLLSINAHSVWAVFGFHL